MLDRGIECLVPTGKAARLCCFSSGSILYATSGSFPVTIRAHGFCNGERRTSIARPAQEDGSTPGQSDRGPDFPGSVLLNRLNRSLICMLNHKVRKRKPSNAGGSLHTSFLFRKKTGLGALSTAICSGHGFSHLYGSVPYSKVHILVQAGVFGTELASLQLVAALQAASPALPIRSQERSAFRATRPTRWKYGPSHPR